mmetsp:Transcript_41456/g.104208  ORF Transcript_41456/g.104208 Transcript_41456/m.104208 type:complete len:585 (+) Transcript_41456:167-1921(+)|eukprot:jgi/Tetstr1/422465/TSEL_013303.t1
MSSQRRAADYLEYRQPGSGSSTYALADRLGQQGPVGSLRGSNGATSRAYTGIQSSGYGVSRTTSSGARTGLTAPSSSLSHTPHYSSAAPSATRQLSRTMPSPATRSAVTTSTAAKGYLARSGTASSSYTPSSTRSQRRQTPIESDRRPAPRMTARTCSMPRSVSPGSSSDSSSSSGGGSSGGGRMPRRSRDVARRPAESASVQEGSEALASLSLSGSRGSYEGTSSSGQLAERRASIHRAVGEMPSGWGVKGLANLGNTCFMNSILQCLMAIPEVVSFFHGAKLPGSAAVSAAFADLVESVWGSRTRGGSFTPRAFLKEVSRKDRRWGGGRQHDSQEFLHFLLEAMQAELNRVKGKPRYQELKGQGTEEEQAAEAWEYAQKWNNSVIDDIFGGLLQSTVVCSACQHPSNCFDKFLDLSIPIPSRSGCSIDECLGSFTEVEKLGKVDGYRCENCKCVVSATKQLQIYYLPKILMLHLKRFSSSSGLGRFSSLSKNNGAVTISLRGLDFGPYCNPLGTKCCESTVYDCIGISNHSGSLGGGHYTAVCQNFKDHKWYNFNDSHASSDSAPTGSSTSAYVLIYRRRGH